MKKLQLKKEVIASMTKDSMSRLIGGDDATGGCPTIRQVCHTVQDCFAVGDSLKCPVANTRICITVQTRPCP